MQVLWIPCQIWEFKYIDRNVVWKDSSCMLFHVWWGIFKVFSDSRFRFWIFRIFTLFSVFVYFFMDLGWKFMGCLLYCDAVKSGVWSCFWWDRRGESRSWQVQVSFCWPCRGKRRDSTWFFTSGQCLGWQDFYVERWEKCEDWHHNHPCWRCQRRISWFFGLECMNCWRSWTKSDKNKTIFW